MKSPDAGLVGCPEPPAVRGAAVALRAQSDRIAGRHATQADGSASPDRHPGWAQAGPRPRPERARSARARADAGEMRTRPRAILHGEGRHALLAMAGPIFHQRSAQVAVRETPRLSEVEDAVADVGLGLQQLDDSAGMAQHSGRRGQDLHQADLAGHSACVAVVAAFDRCDRIGEGRRQALSLRFTGQLLEVELPSSVSPIGQSVKTVDRGRKGQVSKREVDRGSVCSGGAPALGSGTKRSIRPEALSTEAASYAFNTQHRVLYLSEWWLRWH